MRGEQPRGHGESNLNTWRDGTRVLRLMLKQRLLTQRRGFGPAVDVVGAEMAEITPAMADASA